MFWMLPFFLLLGSIAVLPLIRKHWWEKNYPLVSVGFTVPVFFYYLFLLQDTHALVHAGFEYVSFICLIGSLYVVAGGIHIGVKGQATPAVNAMFLFVGAVVSNFLGTTGASMIMVRPWLRTNKSRLWPYHVVFFIFIVSNIGGALTPIGDPPLFLGYLQGVPFFWVLKNVWMIWLLTVALLLAVFYVIDSINFRKSPVEIRQKETAHEEWKFEGLHNLFCLAAILGAVFIKHPLFLREIVMVLAAAVSYKTTPKPVHEKNDFGFGPMKEVAILFFGIFCTMLPALSWLEHNARAIGVSEPGHFFWASGILSAMLDNAPTYLNFLSAAMGLFSVSGKEGVHFLLENHPAYVLAVSVAAVFFGAVTYIGNGPNFLVKSIAEQSGAKTPSFFGFFFRYSLPILIPIFSLVWFIFFRS